METRDASPHATIQDCLDALTHETERLKKLLAERDTAKARLDEMPPPKRQR
jgi:hypothetical protein